MRIQVRHFISAAALVAAQCVAAGAHAQLLDSVKGQMEGLGGSTSSLSSLSAGSAGNAAGVLQYCIKNNYLSGGDAQAVKDKLMDKLPGGASKAESDTGYTSGVQGILKGSDGKSLDLSGSGLKKENTRQACDQVLKQGKSFL